MNQILRIGGLPVMAQLCTSDRWATTSRKAGKDCLFSCTRNVLGEPSEFNQSHVRERFLIIRTPEQALSFFREFGPFDRQEGATDESPSEQALDVSFATVTRFQDILRQLISVPMPDFFDTPALSKSGLTIHEYMDVYVTRQKPTFTVELGYVRITETKIPSPFLRQVSYCVKEALFNSIYIDKMAGAKGAVCEKCGEVFLYDSDKPKRFCTELCANAARQKRIRDARKIAKKNTPQAA